MIPILIILVGVVLAFVGAVLLLRFMSEFSELIAKFNALYSGEVHNLNSELRDELNELNYSYYDILEKQDERLSKVEKLTEGMGSGSAPPFSVTEAESNRMDALHLIDTKLDERQEDAISEDNKVDGNSNVDQIKRLYNKGMPVEDIANKLGLGSGYVDLILSLYVKKGEE